MPSSQEQEKRVAGHHAASMVEDGMWVGLGTGSTTTIAVERIGERFRAGEIRINAVCTSERTERLAEKYGIPVHPLTAERELDVYVDGADQVDDFGDMIKGGGGAHLREKLVALAARRRIIIIDSSKLVRQLGRTFPVPVEIVRFGYEQTLGRLAAVHGCEPVLRQNEGEPFRTDEGNYIADCHFSAGISDPAHMEAHLKSLTGVVETGLFIGLCDVLVAAKGEDAEVKEFGN